MEYLILLIKGFLIGIGKIIPGVSGAMMAISLNVYEKSINSISDFFNDIKNNLKFLFPLGLGILIGISAFSKIIINMLSNYYLPTTLLFVGLIIGGLSGIKKEINLKSSYTIFIIILTIILTIALTKLNIGRNNEYNFLVFIILGFIEAITMIIPGISGTSVLMCLGYYNLIIESFSDFNIIILLPFGIGLIIGIIIMSKIVTYLFSNYREITYTIIYGFSSSTILMMLLITLKNNYKLTEILISLLLIIIGYNITKTIEK